jgi:hypothetical protein
VGYNFKGADMAIFMEPSQCERTFVSMLATNANTREYQEMERKT